MLAEAMNVTTATIWASSSFSNAPMYSTESLASLSPANNASLKATGSAIGRVVASELEEEGE